MTHIIPHVIIHESIFLAISYLFVNHISENYNEVKRIQLYLLLHSTTR